jgi:hypothetical protein
MTLTESPPLAGALLLLLAGFSLRFRIVCLSIPHRDPRSDWAQRFLFSASFSRYLCVLRFGQMDQKLMSGLPKNSLRIWARGHSTRWLELLKLAILWQVDGGISQEELACSR